MSKKVFKNSAVYAIGDFIQIAVSGFLLLPFYTRAMSMADFGLYGVIGSTMVAMTFMVHFGLISTFSRFYFHCNSEEEKREFMGHVIMFHILIALCLVLALLLCKEYIMAVVFPIIKGGGEQYYYYIIIVPILGFISALYAIYLRVLEDAMSYIVFQLSHIFIYVISIVILNIYMKNTLDAVLVSLLISHLIMWLIAILKLQYIFRLQEFITVLKKLIVFCFPIFLAYIMYFMLNRFNVLFLQDYESIENIAIFSFSLQLASALAMVSGAMGKAFQPIIFKQNEESVLKVALKISHYYKVIMSVLMVSLLVLSDYIIWIFAPKSYSESGLIFCILVLSVFVYNFRGVESTVFLYFHKPKYPLYIISFSAALVVSLSIALVPEKGMMGSAYAILAGSSLTYLLNKFYFYKLRSELELRL